MLIEDFFSQYLNGRKDFSGENLQGLDLFNRSLRITHQELFANDLSALRRTEHAVMSRPLIGINISNGCLKNLVAFESNLARSKLIDCDLSNIDARFSKLSGATLKDINLSGADLRYSNLNGSHICGAVFDQTILDNSSIKHALIEGSVINESSFSGTNFSQTRFYNTSCNNSKFINSNFKLSQFEYCDLNSCTLKNLDFSVTKFKSSKLSDCNIESARFDRTIFEKVAFNESTISDAAFIGSNLNLVHFTSCEFDDAVFSNLDFGNTVFSQVSFSNSSFSNVGLNRIEIELASVQDVSFLATDLSRLVDANIQHYGQSHIDYTSIVKTMLRRPAHPLDIDPYPGLISFMGSCGIPNIVASYFIESIRSIQPNQLRNLMRSTFISYGSPDEKFASKLNNDLQANGVATFFFPMNAQFGEKLHSTMKKIDEYERVIIICSEQSLERSGVQYELEKVIEREAREGGGACLIPVALDDFIFNEWKPARGYLKQEILNRVVADFRDQRNYRSQFLRLLQALKNSSPNVTTDV
jgi:uncharacterized protein YjbI with pentapeptide repeats